MSYLPDNSGRSWGRRPIPYLDEYDTQDELYSSQGLQNQTSTQTSDYNAPQGLTQPQLGSSGSYETPTPASSSYLSQNESHILSRSGSNFSNNTLDTSLPSPVAGRDDTFGYGHPQQYPQSPHSTDNHESFRGIERRHSLRNSAPFPTPRRRAGEGDRIHGSNEYPSVNRTRRHQEYPSFDDYGELLLEGYNSPQAPLNYPPTNQPIHQRRTTLAWIGSHLEDLGQRSNQTDISMADVDSPIYADPNDDGRDTRYTDRERMRESPESLAPSMASMTVNVGSAPGSRDDYTQTGDQQPRRLSNGDAHRSSGYRRRPSRSRHEGDSSANVEPREQTQRDPRYPPSASRSQRPPQQVVVRSDGMANPTTQTSIRYQTSGQQISPVTMGSPTSPTSSSAATAGNSQPQGQGYHPGNSTDPTYNHGDGHFQSPLLNGTYNHPYWPTGDERGNDTDSRHPRY